MTPRVIVLPIESHEPTTEMIPGENLKHLHRMLIRAKEESKILDEAEEAKEAEEAEEEKMLRAWEESVHPSPWEQRVPSVQPDQSIQPGSSVQPGPSIQPVPSNQSGPSSDLERWTVKKYHPQSMLIYLTLGSVIGLALMCFFAKYFAAFRRRIATLF